MLSPEQLHTICATIRHAWCPLIRGSLQSTNNLQLQSCATKMCVTSLKLGGFFQVLFAATFFIFRVVIGPFLTWKTLMTPEGSLVIKVGTQGAPLLATFATILCTLLKFLSRYDVNEAAHTL